MLEKYLAPWGNKVPWIDRVIDLEEKLAKAYATACRYATDLFHTEKACEALYEQVSKLREKEYNRAARPFFAAVDACTRVDMQEYRDEMYQGTVMQYRLIIDDFRIASLNPHDVTYFVAKLLMEHKERAAREFGELFLKHIEAEMTRRGLNE